MGINECSGGEEAWQQDEQPGLFIFFAYKSLHIAVPHPSRLRRATFPPGGRHRFARVLETEGLQKQQIVNLRFYRIFTRLFDFPAGMGFGKFRTELWKTFLKGS